MAEQLLDFTKQFDVRLFDQCVNVVLTKPEEKEIHQAIIAFQDHPDAWKRAGTIIEQSQAPQSQVIALEILRKTCKLRWKVLTEKEQGFLRQFVLGIMMKLVANAQAMANQRFLAMKLNEIIVEILHQAWPMEWPSFMPDLVVTAKKSEGTAMNALSLLTMLSESAFDFGDEDITQANKKRLRESWTKEFNYVFELVMMILAQSTSLPLITRTLESVLKFLPWMPHSYVFESKLLETIAGKFFPEDATMNLSLEIFTVVAQLDLQNTPMRAKGQEIVFSLFAMVMQKMAQRFPTTDNRTWGPIKLAKEGQHGAFIRHLTNFLCGTCEKHIKFIESKDANCELVIAAHELIVGLTLINDSTLYKICLEYWMSLVTSLFNERREHKSQILRGRITSQEDYPRLAPYKGVLSLLRAALIEQMRRPKEVLIFQDDNGNVRKELMQDTDSVNLYNSTKQCLVYLTHLDPSDTETLMTSKLHKQMDDTEWGWDSLNKLCWAIGSISGAMGTDMEKQFLVSVIKDLLQLCDQKRGKEHKAIIASNIMYVVGQYPRFLKQHWKFLRTVVNKLFEFMHEKFPGVQDMAVETFLTIAGQCQARFVQRQSEEDLTPYIQTILHELHITVKDLEPMQAEIFYEAVATIIAAEKNANDRTQLISAMMTEPNERWTRTILQAKGNLQSLFVTETIQRIISVLRINIRVATGLKGAYLIQMSKIHLEVLEVYKQYSEYVSNEVKANPNKDVTSQHHIRQMRTIKSEVVKLLEVFVTKAREQEMRMIVEQMMPRFLDPLLGDYNRNVPAARTPEVLSLFATLISKLKGQANPFVPQVVNAVFRPTLQMITRNFEDFPDHRAKLFQLLKAITSNCFQAFYQMGDEVFNDMVKAIAWATRHLERHISDTGLEIMMVLLESVEHTELSSAFYSAFLIKQINQIIDVMTDSMHKWGFHLQAQILAKIFSTIENGQVTRPLWDGPANAYRNNQAFVRSQVVSILGNRFPQTLTKQQAEQFVDGLFRLSGQMGEFKKHLRDFLIQSKEFNRPDGLDNSELFNQEQALAKLRLSEQVGGL